MKPNSKGTEPISPIPFNTYALGTAALLPHAGTSTNDETISVTCVRPDTAARLVINATAGAIQRAALMRFVTAKPGLWALFFMALWLPAAIAVMIEVAVNGSGTNRVLAGIAAVGIVGGFIAVRVGTRQARRRTEAALRRADGDHWQAARWEPGERHAVRVEIASGLRLPWPLPGPTSTVNGVRNLIAMLRVAERRADAAEQQVAKVRVVLADQRSTDVLRVAETREIVERWTSRADAYDNDATMIRDGFAELVDGEPSGGAMKYVLDPTFTGNGEAIQLDIVGGEDMTDVSKRAEVVDPDGNPVATIVGADASAITVLTPGGFTIRDADASGDPLADPDVRLSIERADGSTTTVRYSDGLDVDRAGPNDDPWSPGELSGDIPPLKSYTDVGSDGKLTPKPTVPDAVPGELNDRIDTLSGRARDLGDADRLRGDQDRLAGDTARLGFGIATYPERTSSPEPERSSVSESSSGGSPDASSSGPSD